MTSIAASPPSRYRRATFAGKEWTSYPLAEGRKQDGACEVKQ